MCVGVLSCCIFFRECLRALICEHVCVCVRVCDVLVYECVCVCMCVRAVSASRALV